MNITLEQAEKAIAWQNKKSVAINEDDYSRC
jgi:hypothetical protein